MLFFFHLVSSQGPPAPLSSPKLPPFPPLFPPFFPHSPPVFPLSPPPPPRARRLFGPLTQCTENLPVLTASACTGPKARKHDSPFGRLTISPFAKLMSGFLDNFSTDADIRPASDPLSLYLTRKRCAAARARRRGDRGKEFLSRFRVTPPRFTAFDAASLAHGADLPRVGVATKKTRIRRPSKSGLKIRTSVLQMVIGQNDGKGLWETWMVFWLFRRSCFVLVS